MSVPVSNHKRTHGQFFTVGNPFVLAPFRAWFEAIPSHLSTSGANKGKGKGKGKSRALTLLEPFAGANNIIRLMSQAGYDYPWACFDIDPPAPVSEGFAVQKLDTLAAFPQGYTVAITNPPYLARNSAVRRKLPYPLTQYDDLYKHALAMTLDNTPFVAAIIPESFITAGLFHDRLHCVISLTCPMFDDTEHPVCLALFSPSEVLGSTDFSMYDEDTFLGKYKELSSVLLPVEHGAVAWKFNDPNGSVGLRGVDSNKSASICFIPGSDIPPSEVKHSSRANTRISGLPPHICPQQLIATANELLKDYRARTHDMMMTSFKGLRADGRYRRRLDFAAARNLLDHAVARLSS